jgi:primase-polymerase (primpol)-like protein
MPALAILADEPRWVAWRSELRGGKPTKIPYAPRGGKAKADDPSTWGIRTAAEVRAREIVNGSGGGIGIQLGDLGADLHLVGIDLDSCIADNGTLASWATEYLSAFPTYTERSPSGRGLKMFFMRQVRMCARFSIASASGPMPGAFAAGWPAWTAGITGPRSKSISRGDISR